MKSREWSLFWLLGIIWGTSFLWIKIAVADVHPLVLVGFRTLSAAIGLAIAVWLNRKNLPPWKEIRKRIPAFIILGAFNIALPFGLIAWGEQYIDSGIASIINGVQPLFIIVLAPILISEERFTLPKIAGLVTGFLGVIILMSPNIGSGWNKNLIGQSACLIAVLSYSFSAVFVRLKGKGLPPELQAFMQLTFGTAIIWTITFLVEKPVVLPHNPITWLAMLWLGILGTCIAYIIYFGLIHNVGPTRASMVTYVTPVVAIVLGIVFLGESFHWQSALGTLLILSGIYIVNVQPKNRPAAEVKTE